MITGKSIRTVEPIRGVRAGGLTRIASRLGNLAPIDLTAADLDQRVTYTGPAHYYWAQNGKLTLSAANEWPREWIDGTLRGRHEPEPAITNWQVLNRADVQSTNVVGDQLTRDATGAPDGGAIGRMPVAADSYTVTQDINNVTLVPLTAYNLTAGKWSRIANPGTNTASGKIRLWLGRNAANGQPALYLTQGGNLAVRDWVFSWFAKGSEDGQTFATGFGQIERENYPFATSPVINETTAYTSRAASAVTVAKQQGATGIVVYYTDGTNKAYSFGAATSVTLSMAGAHWSARYISRIEYR